MSEPKSTEPLSPTASSESQKSSAQSQASAQVLPRRLLFSGGLIGLLSQAACSSAEFGGKAASKVKAERANGNVVQPPAAPDAAAQSASDPGAKVADPAPAAAPAPAKADAPAPAPAPTVDSVCHAIDNPTIDPSQVPVAPADKVPVAVFYGNINSALLALRLPAGLDVKQLVICTSKGKLMALHGITGADKMTDGSWRPIVLDNLFLSDKGTALTEIVVLLQLAATSMKATIKIAFFNTFQGKPVVDFGSHTVPTEMIGRQSVVRFTEAAGTFNVDNTVVYPNKYNSTTVRNLQTAKSSSSWTPDTTAIKGVVTDIMGNVINISGSAILEYQVFCTYVDAGNGKFVRSMLQMG